MKSSRYPICPIPDILEGFPLPLIPSLILQSRRHLYLERIVRRPMSRCSSRPTPALNASQRGSRAHTHVPLLSQHSIPSAFSLELTRFRGAAMSRLKGACGPVIILIYSHYCKRERLAVMLISKHAITRGRRRSILSHDVVVFVSICITDDWLQSDHAVYHVQ